MFDEIYVDIMPGLAPGIHVFGGREDGR